MLNLPTRYTYVYYEDGTRDNVAMEDTLTKAEAERYKAMWEKHRKKAVILVSLENGRGDCITRFVFF